MSEEQKEYAIDYIMQLQEENYKLEQENKQLKEERPYLYTNTEWEDILEYQGKPYIELDRYKKREKEIMDKYFHQSKYASEMEDKYISANGILTELEEWLNLEIAIHDEDDTIDTLYSCVLDKIQELNEKYRKEGDKIE